MRLSACKSVRCRLCAEFVVELTSQSGFRVEIYLLQINAAILAAHALTFSIPSKTIFERECEENTVQPM
jgi:hypothetical protein